MAQIALHSTEVEKNHVKSSRSCIDRQEKWCFSAGTTLVKDDLWFLTMEWQPIICCVYLTINLEAPVGNG